MRTCGVILATLVLTASAHAGDKSWTGKIILLKGTKDVQIGYTDDKGKAVYLAKLTGISYRVIGEKNGWLRVSHGGAEGWFPKEDAVVLEEAVAYFTARLKANPADDQAVAYRAEAHLFKDDYEAALKDLNEAIRLKPGRAGWWANRAYVLSLTKDYDKALKDCDEALRLDPKEARAFWVRGNIWRAKKESAKAVEAYGEALRLEPTSIGALYGRANALWDLKDFAGTVKDYEAVLKLQALHESALDELAWLLATCPDEKIRNGKRAVELATTLNKLSGEKNAEHLDTLAAAQAEVGNFEEAVRRQKQALALGPLPKDLQEVYQKRLKLYEDKKKYRDE
jgi:tetratricopeptide (TPR) repeat protein